MQGLGEHNFTGVTYVTTDEISEATGWIYVTTIQEEIFDGSPWPFNGDWFRRLVQLNDGRQFGIVAIVNPEAGHSRILSPHEFEDLDYFIEQISAPPLPRQAEWNEQFPPMESTWEPVSF